MDSLTPDLLRHFLAEHFMDKGYSYPAAYSESEWILSLLGINVGMFEDWNCYAWPETLKRFLRKRGYYEQETASIESGERR